MRVLTELTSSFDSKMEGVLTDWKGRKVEILSGAMFTCVGIGVAIATSPFFLVTLGVSTLGLGLLGHGLFQATSENKSIQNKKPEKMKQFQLERELKAKDQQFKHFDLLLKQTESKYKELELEVQVAGEEVAQLKEQRTLASTYFDRSLNSRSKHPNKIEEILENAGKSRKAIEAVAKAELVLVKKEFDLIKTSIEKNKLESLAILSKKNLKLNLL